MGDDDRAEFTKEFLTGDIGYNDAIRLVMELKAERDQLKARVAELEGVEPTVAVAGVYMDRSIADFRRSVDVLISEGQLKPAPNNALVGVLCDAIRLSRELISAQQSTCLHIDTGFRQAIADLQAALAEKDRQTAMKDHQIHLLSSRLAELDICHPEYGTSLKAAQEKLQKAEAAIREFAKRGYAPAMHWVELQNEQIAKYKETKV